MAPIQSAPFLLGALVTVVQYLTFVLMTYSIINDASAYNNPLGLPPNIAPQVQVMQFVAILVAVVTQDDLIKGLDTIRVIFSTSFFDAFHQSHPIKTIICIILRCLSGCMGLVTSFFLIIITETIYELLLNFTALEFVCQLGAAMFVVCQYGYAGKKCEATAKAISTTTFYVHSKVYRHRKIAFFSVIAFTLIGGWSVVVHRQNDGLYQCKTLLVDFGDDMRPSLGTFSGLYDQIRTNNNRYLSYVDRESEKAIFSYCKRDRFWTFQYYEDGVDDNTDPCATWAARSSTITSYDITAAAVLPWFVQDDYQREAYLEPFVLLCQDCTTYNTCSGKKI